ncbi:MAG: hypothetical protein ACOC1K_02525 [Nanoarchaeota archaeon]
MDLDNFVEKQKEEYNNSDEVFDVVKREEWVRIHMTPDSNLFPIYQQQLKKIKENEKEHVITVINHKRSKKLKKVIKEKYKFLVEWQNKEVCSVDFFKLVKEINNG